MNCIDKNLDIVYISNSKSNFHKEYGKMKKIFGSSELSVVHFS